MGCAGYQRQRVLSVLLVMEVAPYEIIESNTMPTKGQFVAMWNHKGKVWSATLRYSGDQLELFSDSTGWSVVRGYLTFPSNVRYWRI